MSVENPNNTQTNPEDWDPNAPGAEAELATSAIRRIQDQMRAEKERFGGQQRAHDVYLHGLDRGYADQAQRAARRQAEQNLGFRSGSTGAQVATDLLGSRAISEELGAAQAGIGEKKFQAAQTMSDAEAAHMSNLGVLDASLRDAMTPDQLSSEDNTIIQNNLAQLRAQYGGKKDHMAQAIREMDAMVMMFEGKPLAQAEVKRQLDGLIREAAVQAEGGVGWTLDRYYKWLRDYKGIHLGNTGWTPEWSQEAYGPGPQQGTRLTALLAAGWHYGADGKLYPPRGS